MPLMFVPASSVRTRTHISPPLLNLLLTFLCSQYQHWSARWWYVITTLLELVSPFTVLYCCITCIGSWMPSFCARMCILFVCWLARPGSLYGGNMFSIDGTRSPLWRRRLGIVDGACQIKFLSSKETRPFETQRQPRVAHDGARRQRDWVQPNTTHGSYVSALLHHEVKGFFERRQGGSHAAWVAPSCS